MRGVRKSSFMLLGCFLGQPVLQQHAGGGSSGLVPQLTYLIWLKTSLWLDD